MPQKEVHSTQRIYIRRNMYELPQKYSKLSFPQRREVREQYIKEQNGLCYYCKRNLRDSPVQDKKIAWSLFPKNFLRHPIHLHHCHTTDNTIGAVHSYCNAVLWQYFGE